MAVLAYKYSDSISLDLTDAIGIQHFYEQVCDDYNDDVRQRVITEPHEQSKIELGWLEASSVVMNFVHNVPIIEKTEVLDNNACKTINVLLATQEYVLAYALIDAHCRQNAMDLTIKMSSYLK